MHIGIVLIVFAIILVAELPDKSMFAALILGSRYPAWYVWLGASGAFLVHVIIAVTAGKLLTLLPHEALEVVIGLLFLGGAALLIFGKQDIMSKEKQQQDIAIDSKTHVGRKVMMTAFAITFLGEWGDITQIATANYAAKYHDPWSVAIGATLALWTATALAVTVGQRALTLVPPKVLERLTAGVLLIFAIFSFISAIK